LRQEHPDEQSTHHAAAPTHVEDMTIRRLKASTQDFYRRAVAKCAEHFSRSPGELDFEHVRQYQLHLVQSGWEILRTPRGRAYRKRNFHDRWKEAVEAAGIADLHFHDLLGTAVTMLAEAGATIPQIASITGHT
jgi:integrase